MKQSATILSLPPAPQKITAEKAQAILKQEGLNINLQEAAAVVEFLYNLAEMTTHNDYNS